MSSTLDGIFFLSLGTLVCGGVGLAIKGCYKIKCAEVDCCCGLLKVKRDIDEEIKYDLEQQQANNSQQKRSSLSLGFNKI